MRALRRSWKRATLHLKLARHPALAQPPLSSGARTRQPHNRQSRGCRRVELALGGATASNSCLLSDRQRRALLCRDLQLEQNVQRRAALTCATSRTATAIASPHARKIQTTQERRTLGFGALPRAAWMLMIHEVQVTGASQRCANAEVSVHCQHWSLIN